MVDDFAAPDASGFLASAPSTCSKLASAKNKFKHFEQTPCLVPEGKEMRKSGKFGCEIQNRYYDSMRYQAQQERVKKQHFVSIHMLSEACKIPKEIGQRIHEFAQDKRKHRQRSACQKEVHRLRTISLHK